MVLLIVIESTSTVPTVDAAIILFSTENKSSYDKIEEYHQKVMEINPGIPVVIVGNKVDTRPSTREVKLRQILVHQKLDLTYFDVSTKETYNYEKPFISLLRALTRDPHLHLVQDIP